MADPKDFTAEDAESAERRRRESSEGREPLRDFSLCSRRALRVLCGEKTPTPAPGTPCRQPGIYAYLTHNLIEAVELGATAQFKVEGEWNNDLMTQVKPPSPIAAEEGNGTSAPSRAAIIRY